VVRSEVSSWPDRFVLFFRLQVLKALPRVMMCLRALVAGNASQMSETEIVDHQARHGRRSVLMLCARLGRGRGPGKQLVEAIDEDGTACSLTLEAGSETGSNEKFSMRFA